MPRSPPSAWLSPLLPQIPLSSSAVTLSGGIVDNAADNFNAITGNPGTSFVLGYTFTMSSALAVTAMGFYDANNTALDANNTALDANNNPTARPRRAYSKAAGSRTMAQQSPCQD